MFSSGLLKILFWAIALFISLIIFFLIGSATVQRINDFIALRTYRKKDKRRKKDSLKRYKREEKAAPANLSILMKSQNKSLFEKFAKLLDNVEWPDQPTEYTDEDGKVHFPSVYEIEDYDEELEDAIEEEDKMYTIYLSHIQSKNILISKSELLHVVDLYNSKLKDENGVHP